MLALELAFCACEGYPAVNFVLYHVYPVLYIERLCLRAKALPYGGYLLLRIGQEQGYAIVQLEEFWVGREHPLYGTYGGQFQAVLGEDYAPDHVLLLHAGLLGGDALDYEPVAYLSP